VCLWQGLLWWFLSSCQQASGGCFRHQRVWSWSYQVLRKFIIHILQIIWVIWELVICEFNMWWILSHISMAPRLQGISIPMAKIRTWKKGMGFRYTHVFI
jgi:hypothetical protein